MPGRPGQQDSHHPAPCRPPSWVVRGFPDVWVPGPGPHPPSPDQVLLLWDSRPEFPESSSWTGCVEVIHDMLGSIDMNKTDPALTLGNCLAGQERHTRKCRFANSVVSAAKRPLQWLEGSAQSGPTWDAFGSSVPRSCWFWPISHGTEGLGLADQDHFRAKDSLHPIPETGLLVRQHWTRETELPSSSTGGESSGHLLGVQPPLGGGAGPSVVCMP